MKKFTRYLALLLTLFTLLLVPSMPTYATNTNSDNDNAQGNDVDHDKVNIQTGQIEGASKRRSGYLIWCSDESGQPYNGKVVFVPTEGRNSLTWRDTSHMRNPDMTTHTGARYNEMNYTPVPWGVSPFHDGAVETLRSFVREKYGDYDTGGRWVLENYLGMTPTELEDFMSLDEAYLNFESVMLAGVFEVSEFSGDVLLANALGWARATEKNNWLNQYTHGALCNTISFDQSWFNISPGTNLGSLHSSAEILATPYTGWGICSFRLVPAENQVVKVYTSGGGVVDDTIYTSCSKNYKIENDGDYRVKRWSIGADKTTVTGKQPYNAVTSGVNLTRTGTAPAEIQLTSQEKAIFIEYEKEPDPLPPPSNNSEALRAYEVNYPYPKMVGVVSRTDTGALPADYDFNTGFQNRKNSMNSRDDIRNYQEATSDFTVHENFSGALSGLNISQLHLYHTGVGKYKPYNQAKKFPLGEVIRPHYSYNLTREVFEPELTVSSEYSSLHVPANRA